jgi:hypothetical protein
VSAGVHRRNSSDESDLRSAGKRYSVEILDALMNQISRRKLLLFGLLGGSSVISGCVWDDSTSGGGLTSAPPSGPSPAPTPAPPPGQPPAPGPTPAPPPAGWSVSPTPYFLAGTGSTFDLSTTLPPGVRKGGTFGIASNGAPLPAGMSLAPTGLLSVGTAGAGRTDGVIFTYAEPVG